jgi:hypothetical protein
LRHPGNQLSLKNAAFVFHEQVAAPITAAEHHIEHCKRVTATVKALKHAAEGSPQDFEEKGRAVYIDVNLTHRFR